MMRECLSLLEKGVVEARALDDIVQYSIGVRMALNGPLRQRDLNGLDTHLNIARYLYPDLDARDKPAALLEDYVAQGRLGAKTGQGFYSCTPGARSRGRNTRHKSGKICKTSLKSPCNTLAEKTHEPTTMEKTP